MTVKAITLLLLIAIVIAFVFRNEIYKFIKKLIKK